MYEMNIYLFLSIVFLFVFLVGRLLQKIHIPWIFSALLMGAVLAINNPFSNITESETFTFLSSLGMYLLLFIIGFEINLKQLKEKKVFFLKTAFAMVLGEAFFGSIFIHYVFDYSWFVSIIVALSFSTVGEAILVPILHEFNLIKSSLGQAILGIGALDDIFEVVTLVLVIIFVGSGVYGNMSIFFIIASLITLFLMSYALGRLKKQGEKFNFLKIETLFLFVIATMFLFIGIGEFAEASALGAILAGIGLRTFIPDERLEVIESEVRAVCYGLFAPIFFLWAGLGLNMSYLFSNILMVVLVILISSGAKFAVSVLLCRKELGLNNSLLLGAGLSVRFSTSIVVIKILYDSGVINDDLYSVILASSIIFTLFVPIILSQLFKNYYKEVL